MIIVARFINLLFSLVSVRCTVYTEVSHEHDCSSDVRDDIDKIPYYAVDKG